MIRGLVHKHREILEVPPENYLGVVRVDGAGLPQPKLIGFTKPGGYGPDSGSWFKRVGQTANQYGATIVVPAGEWDLWIRPADGTPAFRLEQKARVEAGVVNVFE
jgi:hypothetical protein